MRKDWFVCSRLTDCRLSQSISSLPLDLQATLSHYRLPSLHPEIDFGTVKFPSEWSNITSRRCQHLPVLWSDEEMLSAQRNIWSFSLVIWGTWLPRPRVHMHAFPGGDPTRAGLAAPASDYYLGFLLRDEWLKSSLPVVWDVTVFPWLMWTFLEPWGRRRKKKKGRSEF